MAWRVVRDRRVWAVLLTAAVVSGCGAAVDARLDRSVREVARSYEAAVELPRDDPKESRRDEVRLSPDIADRSGRGSGLGAPGLTFRWGMSYFDQNESLSSALSLAMHAMLLRRMAVEIGVMASFPLSSARQTDTAFVGGTLSWLWYLGSSETFRPYFVVGNGVGAGNRRSETSLGSVLVSFVGGLGFDVWLTPSFGFGLDCRAFAALAAETPSSARRGVICTAAIAFSPSSD